MDELLRRRKLDPQEVGIGRRGVETTTKVRLAKARRLPERYITLFGSTQTGYVLRRRENMSR